MDIKLSLHESSDGRGFFGDLPYCDPPNTRSALPSVCSGCPDFAFCCGPVPNHEQYCIRAKSGDWR